MEQNHKNKKDKKSNYNAYARYSSLAFQMGAIIFMGVFGGVQIDKYLNFTFPLFTVVLSLLSVILSIYIAVKDL